MGMVRADTMLATLMKIMIISCVQSPGPSSYQTQEQCDEEGGGGQRDWMLFYIVLIFYRTTPWDLR